MADFPPVHHQTSSAIRTGATVSRCRTLGANDFNFSLWLIHLSNGEISRFRKLGSHWAGNSCTRIICTKSSEGGHVMSLRWELCPYYIAE